MGGNVTHGWVGGPSRSESRAQRDEEVKHCVFKLSGFMTASVGLDSVHACPRKETKMEGWKALMVWEDYLENKEHTHMKRVGPIFSKRYVC